MKYCKQLTDNHIVIKEFPSVLKNLNAILIEEGCTLNSSFSSSNANAIDGDKLEEFISKKENKSKSKSMDLVFGIKNNLISKFQLVELKLNCTTFHFLNKNSFLEKVSGTQKALGGNNFNSDYYILFNDKFLQQAKKHLFRINPKLNNKFKAIDVEGLYSKFF